MKTRQFVPLVVAALLPFNAFAETISVDANGDAWEVFHYRNVSGPNSIGRNEGDRLTFGAVNVTPNGYDGTTANASQNGVERDVVFFPTTINPNQFGAGVDYSPDLTGSWQITFQNGGDQLVVDTPEVGDVPLLDRVSNMRITSGANSVTPSFAWDPVVGADQYKVSIYDLRRRNEEFGTADRIWVSNPDGGPNGLTYEIPEGVLDPDGIYTIEVRSQITRTSGTNPSGSSQAGAALSTARTYFDFSLVDFPNDGDLFLPVVDQNTNGNPVYNFDNPVLANQVQFYDPLVAIGYDYQIGSGNPFFNSFILPEIGDDIYDLYLWDGADFILETNVVAGEEYFFGSNGVDRFRILGIETGAMLDPTDPTAFVTGLSFVSDGQFTGTMTPITVDVPAAVPLPASWLFLVAGLGGIGLIKRRQKS